MSELQRAKAQVLSAISSPVITKRGVRGSAVSKADSSKHGGVLITPIKVTTPSTTVTTVTSPSPSSVSSPSAAKGTKLLHQYTYQDNFALLSHVKHSMEPAESSSSSSSSSSSYSSSPVKSCTPLNSVSYQEMHAEIRKRGGQPYIVRPPVEQSQSSEDEVQVQKVVTPMKKVVGKVTSPAPGNYYAAKSKEEAEEKINFRLFEDVRVGDLYAFIVNGVRMPVPEHHFVRARISTPHELAIQQVISLEALNRADMLDLRDTDHTSDRRDTFRFDPSKAQPSVRLVHIDNVGPKLAEAAGNIKEYVRPMPAVPAFPGPRWW